MKYYAIRADVPGRLAGETIWSLRAGGHPDRVYYIFECWPEADILKSLSVFLVSEKLAASLQVSKLTGFELKPCEGSKGEQFEIESPGRGDLPKYIWLDINGRATMDDFGTSREHRLVISERAFDFLKGFNLERAEIVPL